MHWIQEPKLFVIWLSLILFRAPTPSTEKFGAEDLIISSPGTQTVSGSAAKFLEPQNPLFKDASCLSNRGRPPGSIRTESVKSAEPGRWVSSVGQDGFSTGSTAKVRSSAFRRSSSSTRHTGGSSRRKGMKSRQTTLSSSCTDSDDNDDVDDASLSSRN